MEQMTVKWTGTNPMLMHNERLADPLNEYAKRLKALTSVRGNAKSTEAHIEEVARAEWEGGLYYDPEVGPYVPAFNILAAISSGARLSKLGKEIERGVVVVGDMIPLVYKGPRDLDGMWAAKMRDRSGVKVGQQKVMRTRPKFQNWALEFDVAYENARITRDDLLRVMRDAGAMTGIGDFRARYGRFEVSA